MSLRNKNWIYAIGGATRPIFESEQDEASQPRAEYQVILRQYEAPLVDLCSTRQQAGAIVSSILKRGKQSFAVAYHSLSKYRPDIVLASGEDVGLPLGLIASISRCRPKIYIITHGSYFGSNNFGRFMSLFRYASHVHYLCLSESLTQTLIQRFRVAPERVHNMGYAADTCYFSPSGRPSNPCLIASAGAANRDYSTLIDAVRPLPAKLTIACGSAWFPLKVQLGELPSNVSACPHSYPELRSLYAQSSFVVVPLHPGKHACGYAVIADAMAAGRAVIATRTDAISDFIVEGETGFYVRSGDVEDLRAKIDFLLSNPEIAYRMGCQARSRMESLYSLDSYCRHIVEKIG